MPHFIASKPDSVILSSELAKLTVIPSGPHFDVKLSYLATSLLEERFYGVSGSAQSIDLRDIVEEFMLAADIAFGVFSLSVGDNETIADSVTLRVLFCDKLCQGDYSDFAQNNFLTTKPVRRVAPDMPVKFSFFATQGSSISTTLSVGYELNGMAASKTVTLGDADAVATADAVVSIDLTPDDYNTLMPDNAVLQYIRLLAGTRIAYLFIDRALSLGQTFVFNNCFNVPEVISLPAKTTLKTELEKSEAFFDGELIQYDRSSTSSYEVESGPLSADEAEWANKLLTSPHILRIENNNLVPVIITSLTSEIADDGENTATVKFTWRYPAKRTVLRLSDSTKGIFSAQFDKSFC